MEAKAGYTYEQVSIKPYLANQYIMEHTNSPLLLTDKGNGRICLENSLFT